MKKIFLFVLIFSGVLGFKPAGILADMSSATYPLFADVIGAGGLASSTSTNYLLRDTLAEPIIASATSTSDSYGIKAGFQELYPDQFITLSVGSSSVDLGALSNLSVKTASHTLIVDSNAVNGFTITLSGATLAKGTDDINAIGATAASSTPGTEQFGINLAANTSPSVGVAASGSSPIAAVAGQYALANSFAFASGNTVASASSDINATTFTVSYLANIGSGTVFGTYTTILTYAATANF